jgi:hypothetical protein
MCADAGRAIAAPTRMQAVTATASTLKRRLMDLRIFSLRETGPPGSAGPVFSFGFFPLSVRYHAECVKM